MYLAKKKTRFLEAGLELATAQLPGKVTIDVDKPMLCRFGKPATCVHMVAAGIENRIRSRVLNDRLSIGKLF